MGPFTRDGAYYSARIDRRSLLLLRQLVSEILVVLDDPSDAEGMSIMVSASTGPEDKRDAPVERSLEFQRVSVPVRGGGSAVPASGCTPGRSAGPGS